MKIVTVNAVTHVWNAECPECGEECINADDYSTMIEILDEYAICTECGIYVIPRQKVFRLGGHSMADVKKRIKRESGE